MTPDELRQLYRGVFNSEDGQRVIDHLKTRFWFHAPVHAPGDTHETAYRDGQRSIVLSLIAMLQEDHRELPTTTIEE
jgi:hypothetical protein|tara:strand:+ start:4520 stop:4750 length:231 start_codon:yes stop_codon:yes gene_type:complete